jgi:hypothetical protein
MRKYIILILIFTVKISVSQIVQTPRGVQLPSNALFDYHNQGYTNWQLQAFQDNVSNGLYGNSCVVLGNYSMDYNCHGYAWHTSTGGSQIGIRQPIYGGVDYYTYGSSPSYSQVSYNNQGGLRVRYSEDHSAVTTYYPGLYISKWAPGPLVRHSANDVPIEYGSPASYWTCNYTPPLYGVYLDNVQQSNTSAFPVSWGSHSLRISYGLDPDTTPFFQSIVPSTVVNSQSGTTANFTFSGMNSGGMTVNMCGFFRYSFIFYKPNGARMAVYPNPVEGEATVEVNYSDEEQYLVPVIEDNRVKIENLSLYDASNNIKQRYVLSNDGSNRIRFDKGLKGVYYLKAVFSDGTSQTKRILIKE